MDLALNNLQRLICHKTHQTKPNHLHQYFSINVYLSLCGDVFMSIVFHIYPTPPLGQDMAQGQFF